jgi:hypothetical protein
MKGQEGPMMEAKKKPFDSVRGVMLGNLEKSTQSYIDMVERTMRGFPGASEEQIAPSRRTLKDKLQPRLLREAFARQ